MSGPVLLAPPTAGQSDALRETLLRSSHLPVYAEVFAAWGVSDEAIRTDAVAALRRLPLFVGEMHGRLARASLALRRFDLGGVELSSGVSGPAKRRILSEEDVLLDAAMVTRLLHLAGVRDSDRVVAVELAVTPLAAAFLEGCERLGVRDSTALAWRPGWDLAPLRRLAPSVLIAPPSLLAQLAAATPDLRLVIYNGDRLADDVRERLRAAGAGVRSLYGLTETSALGIECSAENGVHLAPEHALFELRNRDAGHELIVTTLGFGMPLLRYPTGDRVRLLPGDCRCGSLWPRVDVLGRIGARFALFEVETSVDLLADWLLGDPAAMIEVTIDDAPGGRAQITLGLPIATRPRWRAMRARLRAHPLLGYLFTTGLVRARFHVTESTEGRKIVRLRDRRQGETAHAG